MLIGNNSALTRQQAVTQKPHYGGSSAPIGEQVAPDVVTVGEEGQHKKVHLFNYVASDCNLQQYQEQNVVDMQKGTPSTASTHLTAMIDAGHHMDALQGTFNGAISVYIQKSDSDKIDSPVVAKHGVKVDMSNAETMGNAMVTMQKRFPSDIFMVAKNDHGGGIVGAMSDDSDGGFMSIADNAKADGIYHAATGKKIDLEMHDACLDQMLEFGYEVKDHVKLFAASQETIGGAGLNYTGITNASEKKTSVLNPGVDESGNPVKSAMAIFDELSSQRINMGAEEFGKLLVEQNKANQRSVPTYSLVDTAKLDTVAGNVDNFANFMLEKATKEEKAKLKNIIKTGCDTYAGGSAPYGAFKDLYQISKSMYEAFKDSNKPLADAAMGLMTSIKGKNHTDKNVYDGTGAVLANESSQKYSKSFGLGIFANVNARGNSLGYNYENLAFAKEHPSWGKLMLNLSSLPTSKEEEMEMTRGGAEPNQPQFLPDGSPFPVRKEV